MRWTFPTAANVATEAPTNAVCAIPKNAHRAGEESSSADTKRREENPREMTRCELAVPRWRCMRRSAEVHANDAPMPHQSENIFENTKYSTVGTTQASMKRTALVRSKARREVGVTPLIVMGTKVTARRTSGAEENTLALGSAAQIRLDVRPLEPELWRTLNSEGPEGRAAPGGPVHEAPVRSAYGYLSGPLRSFLGLVFSFRYWPTAGMYPGNTHSHEAWFLEGEHT